MSTMITKEEREQIIDDLKSIYEKYPSWMNQADYVKTQKFKQHVNQAMQLTKKRDFNHIWVVQARSLLREHANLYWSLNGA